MGVLKEDIVIGLHSPYKRRFTQIHTLTDSASEETIVQNACAILQHGGVVVCATDTGYLLGVDGLNPEAIRKIYQIKERSFDKPIHLVVSDMTMAKILAYIHPEAEQVFQRFMPGPLTLIVKKKPIVPDLLVGGLESVGLRMPDNEFLLRLVKAVGKPVTATSANRSGKSTPYTVEQVLTELGDAVEQVDLIIDQGETQHAMPSTILDLSHTPPKILREGPLTADMLAEVLAL
jgi:L-threonylcarbamoyladenylate synthase